MPKRLLVCIIMGLLIASISVWSAGEEESQEEVTLTYWGLHGGGYRTAVESVFEAYNAQGNGTTVVYEEVPGLWDKTVAALASGDVPDFMFTWSQLIAGFARRDQLLALDEYFTGDITKDDFIPTLVDFATHDGSLYGLPAYPWTWDLYWNKTLFEEAGLDPDSPPTTLEELNDYIHRVTKLDANGHINSMGMMPFANWDIYQWFYFFGGSLWDEATETLTLNHPKNIEAVVWMTDLVSEWGIENVQNFRGAQGDYHTENYHMWTGRITFDLMGTWNYQFIKDNKPDLQWGVSAPPLARGVPDGTILLTCDYNIIPALSEHPDQAADVLRFWYGKESATTIGYGFGTYTPIGKWNEDPSFIANHPNPNIELFAEQAAHPNAFMSPPLPIMDFVMKEVSAAIEEAIYGKKTPEQAMNDLQERSEEEFALFKRRYN